MKIFTVELHDMSTKWVLKVKILFFFAPRLDFGYASKPN
jgi:hypothetical protein